jgi:undecaprenyl-diphosphatase
MLYLRAALWRIAVAWGTGLVRPGRRGPDWRFGWAILLGSVPIGLVGLVFQRQIETTLRSLWFVAAALLLWSAVMWVADRTAAQARHEDDVRWQDTLLIGLAQCLALVPGVSRSGATMSAGLLRGLDRVTVTRLSFFLSIPALLGATVLQTARHYDDIADGVGWTSTLTATVTSFLVAYAAVAFLLRFIARHSYALFIWYRVALGVVLLLLLVTGTIPAT